MQKEMLTHFTLRGRTGDHQPLLKRRVREMAREKEEERLRDRHSYINAYIQRRRRERIRLSRTSNLRKSGGTEGNKERMEQTGGKEEMFGTGSRRGLKTGGR